MSDASDPARPDLGPAERAPGPESGPDVLADPGSVVAPLSLLASWARSLSLTYFVVLMLAALALAFGWSSVEWAFDARRAFR